MRPEFNLHSSGVGYGSNHLQRACVGYQGTRRVAIPNLIPPLLWKTPQTSCLVSTDQMINDDAAKAGADVDSRKEEQCQSQEPPHPGIYAVSLLITSHIGSGNVGITIDDKIPRRLQVFAPAATPDAAT